MTDTLNNVTKTGVCDSCNQEKVLTATPHNQNNNPVLHWYCDVCKFASEKEKRVTALLRQIAAKDPAAAEDPQVVAQLHEKVATEILLEKAKIEALAANEQIVPTESIEPATPEPEPVIQEAEIVPTPGETPEPTEAPVE